MGLFSSMRAGRTNRKAEKKARKGEKKAIKYRAKAQAKAEGAAERKLKKKQLRTEGKFHKRAQKDERKTAKVSGKAQERASKAEAKSVAQQAKVAAETAMFSPAKIRRYLTVGRMVAPIVVPVAYRGAVAARAKATEFKAQRAGVPTAVLNQFGGPSATLRARVETARQSTAKVAGAESSTEATAFVRAMTERLNNLELAADAADSMPPAQRKAAHRAIEQELTAIDNDLLARLNVYPT